MDGENGILQTIGNIEGILHYRFGHMTVTGNDQNEGCFFLVGQSAEIAAIAIPAYRIC